VKVLQAAITAMKAGRPVALCTVVGVDGSAPRHSGARMLVDDEGDIVGTIGGGEWERRVIEAALVALNEGTARRLQAHLTRDLGMCCGGAMDVLIEPLSSVERLHLFGAGHVGEAIAPLARGLGFEVTVYDERDDWLTAQRFPDCTLVEKDPRRALPSLGARDYAVIVTHSHQLDQDLLQSLIGQPFAYLGMIGSRAKVVKFRIRLAVGGVDESLFERVHAPIGLDIGAETPAEIAVSVAAELVRVRRSHEGPVVPMRERTARSGRPHRS
jgi:xanthine dehydrogenase accessory factor